MTDGKQSSNGKDIAMFFVYLVVVMAAIIVATRLVDFGYEAAKTAPSVPAQQKVAPKSVFPASPGANDSQKAGPVEDKWEAVYKRFGHPIHVGQPLPGAK